MKSQPDPLNLFICGIGGQGNILISRLIGRALSKKGYFVTVGETFGSAQRGGAVFSGLRISKRKYYGPLIPEGQGHIILSLEPLETLRILNAYGNADIVTLSNTKSQYPIGVLSKRSVYPDLEKLKAAIQRLSKSSWFLNATDMAMELGSPISANIVMLGALIGSNSMPLSIEQVEEEVKDTFPGSKSDLNLRALKKGFQETRSK
ncbi:MAG: indolepyruvate oxidoreductase subunit beta [Deltaproteobacteria bacterium]|nr:MAG: indolepyruvate oxidoreductase subunit beta [Deltaproteobacteria bacterium]